MRIQIWHHIKDTSSGFLDKASFWDASLVDVLRISHFPQQMFGRLYTHSVNVQLNKGSHKSTLPILSSKGLFWDSHSPLRQGSAPVTAAQSKPEVAVNTGRKPAWKYAS